MNNNNKTIINNDASIAVGYVRQPALRTGALAQWYGAQLIHRTPSFVGQMRGFYDDETQLVNIQYYTSDGTWKAVA